jgi:hypothetical protein
MRETCAHFTDAADDANFLARPFLVLLAELLCRIFGKIEDIVLLWRAGLIPPPAPKPAPAPRLHARKIHNKTRGPRTSRRTPVLRVLARLQGPRPQGRAIARPFPIDRGHAPPRKPAPARRIDRYPKPQSAQTAANPSRTSTPILLRLRNKTRPKPESPTHPR